MDTVDKDFREPIDLPALEIDCTVREIIELMQETGTHLVQTNNRGTLVGHLGFTLGANKALHSSHIYLKSKVP